MKQLLPLYYIAITCILLTQAVMAVYQQSTLVNRADRLHELEVEKQTLLKEQLVLRNELSQSTAISAVMATADQSAFQAISQPIVITGTTAVAASAL